MAKKTSASKLPAEPVVEETTVKEGDAPDTEVTAADEPEILAEAEGEISGEMPSEEAEASEAGLGEGEEPAPSEEIPAEETAGPAGVRTPDGRNVLDYSVLAAERERAAQLEAMIADERDKAKAAESRAAQLESMLQDAQGRLAEASPQGYAEGGSVEDDLPDLPEHGDVPDEEHESLADTFGVPTAAEHIRAIPILVRYIKALQERVNQLIDLEQGRADREEQAHQEQLRLADEALRKEEEEAADNHPYLRHIQYNHPEVFDDFMDNHFPTISKHAEHGKLPLSDRIGKALEITKVVHGLRGFVEGGQVPVDYHDASGGGEGTVATAADLPEPPEMEQALDTDPNNPPEINEAEQVKTVPAAKDMTDAQIKARLGAGAAKPAAPRKTITTLSSVPGGMPLSEPKNEPLIKTRGHAAYQEEMRKAKTPKQIEEVSRRWMTAG